MKELYLYQTLHLRNRRPRLLAEHAALLAAEARTCFGIRLRADLPEFARHIAALAAAERFPCDLSAFVRWEVTADGMERLLSGGVSIYEGYALRSLMPNAVTVAYDMPFGEAPTSVREAAALLAQRQAELAGASVAVRCDRTGMLLSADDAPLFAVRKGVVYTSPAPQSVERDLIVRACDAARIRLAEHPVLRTELALYDELFYADHRGVTALAHCDRQPFMSLVAERVAVAMEALFREG